MTAHDIDKTKVVVHEHRARFQKYMSRVIRNMADRIVEHDNSKLSAEELEPYASVIGEFGKHQFGSEGYNKVRESLEDALQHHYAHNRHHPEHFAEGIHGMNLVDLIEMLCDWKSATQNTGGNGDLMKSIGILSEKYGISPQLVQIFINTAKDFGML